MSEKDKNKNSEIGYKKPPKKTQFKKGKSGNPKGRPKEEAISMIDLIGKVFYKEITVSSNGQVQSMSQAEAFLTQVYRKALEGHGPSIKTMMDFYKLYMGIDQKQKSREQKEKKKDDDYTDPIEAARAYKQMIKDL